MLIFMFVKKLTINRFYKNILKCLIIVWNNNYLYKKLVRKSHDNGLKVIMNVI